MGAVAPWLATTRPSLTRLFTNSSSGRNRYQPAPASTTRPRIQLRRFILDLLEQWPNGMEPSRCGL